MPPRWAIPLTGVLYVDVDVGVSKRWKERLERRGRASRSESLAVAEAPLSVQVPEDHHCPETPELGVGV